MTDAAHSPALRQAAGPALPADRRARLEAAARDLEAAFLAEMLSAAGLGRPVEGPGGGGIGEAQFASFLTEAQARAITGRGGLGLAEALFRALQRGEG
ncbi:MAG: rod-binding protein [Rhodobacteraceae bacterium]|jgi:Rod binding domain-containing protein|nr:rod-binding protein [Paracoccaceae bacterium]